MADKRIELEDIRLPFWLWFRARLVPWALRHWGVWAAPLTAAVGAYLSIIEAFGRPPLWWSSLTMQLLGLLLSGSALVISAIEMGADGPIKTLNKALKEFPAYLRPRIVRAHSEIRMPRVRAYSSIHVGFPEDVTDKQRIDYLIRSFQSLESSTEKALFDMQGSIGELGDNIAHLAKRTNQKQNEIEQRIRGISTGNFYQVLFGLVLLSIGSIASLFLT